jgi:hypothetical protein
MANFGNKIRAPGRRTATNKSGQKEFYLRFNSLNSERRASESYHGERRAKRLLMTNVRERIQGIR